MALSKIVQRELHHELKQLQALHDAATARIRALEAVLNDIAYNGTRVSGVRPSGVSRAVQPSVRATVIKLLEQGASSSASELARQLESSGFRVGGRTTLRERVAHELSRLRRMGIVRRARDGQYELARREVNAMEKATPLAEEAVPGSNPESRNA